MHSLCARLIGVPITITGLIIAAFESLPRGFVIYIEPTPTSRFYWKLMKIGLQLVKTGDYSHLKRFIKQYRATWEKEKDALGTFILLVLMAIIALIVFFYSKTS